MEERHPCPNVVWGISGPLVLSSRPRCSCLFMQSYEVLYIKVLVLDQVNLWLWQHLILEDDSTWKGKDMSLSRPGLRSGLAGAGKSSMSSASANGSSASILGDGWSDLESLEWWLANCDFLLDIPTLTTACLLMHDLVGRSHNPSADMLLGESHTVVAT